MALNRFSAPPGILANNVVSDNRALRNGIDGLVIVGDGVASRNRAEFNDVGIFVQGFTDGGRNRAKHNRINCQGVACQN